MGSLSIFACSGDFSRRVHKSATKVAATLSCILQKLTKNQIK